MTSAYAVATDPPPAPTRRSTWTGVARSAGAKLLVLPVSAVLGVVVSRLVIDNYGVDAFAQYGLLVGIGALLPFVDLGMAAPVMNAVGASDSPATDPRVRAVLVSALRLLVVSAVAVAAIAGAVTFLGLWPALLGGALLPGSGPAVALACLLLIAVTAPVGIGQRILAGLGLNHVSVAVLGLQTPFVLTAVLVFLRWDLPAGEAVAVVAYAATLVLSGACTVIALRRLRPVFGEALRQVPKLRSVRGARVLDVAWPMLVLMVAVPLAMQSDRIVLSHRSTSDVLAEYNLAAQMFTPVWAVVSAGGLALWPVYAKARARGGGTESPMPMVWVFGGSAAVMAGGVALAAPFLADVASGGALELGTPLVAGFTVLMVLQGLKYPLGVYLTDARGLRFQAAMIALMLPVNVGLSWHLAGPLGAAGPVVGSVISVALFELAGNAWYVRRRLRAPAGMRGGT